MSCNKDIIEKRYTDLTLEDAMYAMSLGMHCVCHDGEVIIITNDIGGM